MVVAVQTPEPPTRQKPNERRIKRRTRAVARVTAPIPESLRAHDPLLHDEKSAASGILSIVLLVIGAILLHAFVLGILYVTGSALQAMNPVFERKDQKIELTVIEPPPPPPPVEPEPEPEPEEQARPEPKKPKPKPKKKEPPPPDPIDVPEEPPPPPKKKPRRIVGLSLESTVQGGGGPAFAVGNTRMGVTKRKAEEAKKVKKLVKSKAPPPVNRVAQRIPTGSGKKLVKPKPRGPALEPPYPEEYRAQNLEGRVVLELDIDASGKVRRVRVVSKSPYDKFNDAAVATAKKQRFSAATRGGEPISFTIPFIYRFTLDD